MGNNVQSEGRKFIPRSERTIHESDYRAMQSPLSNDTLLPTPTVLFRFHPVPLWHPLCSALHLLKARLNRALATIAMWRPTLHHRRLLGPGGFATDAISQLDAILQYPDGDLWGCVLGFDGVMLWRSLLWAMQPSTSIRETAIHHWEA
jgi:hypothetical protein